MSSNQERPRRIPGAACFYVFALFFTRMKTGWSGYPNCIRWTRCAQDAHYHLFL